MFCPNCGTQIPENTQFCENCGMLVKTGIPAVTPTPQSNQQKTNTMYGFGKGLAGAILGVFGVLFSLLGYILVLVGIEGVNNPAYAVPAEILGVGIIFLVLALIPCILSLIFGIQSIKLFIRVRKEKSGKAPIPGFICGIGGIVMSGSGLLYFISLLMLLFFLILA